MTVSYYETSPARVGASRTLSYFSHPAGADTTQPGCWQWTRLQPLAYNTGIGVYPIGASFDSYMGYNYSVLYRLLVPLIFHTDPDDVRRIVLVVSSYGNAPYMLPAWRVFWGDGLTWQGAGSLRGWGAASFPASTGQLEKLAACPVPPYDIEDQSHNLTARWEIDLDLARMKALVEPYPGELGTYRVPLLLKASDECYSRTPAEHVPSTLWDMSPSWRTPLWLNDMMMYPRIKARIYYRSGRTLVPLLPGPTAARGGRPGPTHNTRI